MRLAQLEYFKALCECGSFTKAAEQVHITQPSLTKAIKELEQEIGFSLLIRTPKGVMPTENGKVFLTHCQRIDLEMKSLQAFIDSVHVDVPVLRIGMPPIFGISFIPEIEQYLRESPLHLSIQWIEGASVKLHEMLRHQEIDAAVLPESLLNLNGLSFKTFRYVEEQLCISKHHPLADRKTVSLKELTQEKFAFFSEDTGQELLLNDMFRDTDFFPVRQHNCLSCIRAR